MIAETVDAAGLPEGAYAARLGEVARSNPDVSIGSYPSFVDGGFRNQIVVRGRDADKVGAAIREVVTLLAGLRADRAPV